MDLCSGSLWKKIFVYSVPLMFTNILQVLFNMSDVAVVGKFAGPIALGAVGSTSILVTLFTGILLGLASGVNALTALHIGSKDDEGVKRTVHTAVIICLAGGILITVFGILFSHNILALMNTKDELIDGAVLYLRIYLLGMPALGLYNFGNAVLSAAGDTKRPLYYLAFAGVVNVILNLFFVIVCHLGVAGVALASMISQFISAFLILRALLTGKEKYCLRLSEIRFDKRKAVGILQIGIPSAFQYSLFAIANLFVQSSVNSFDHILVEGIGIQLLIGGLDLYLRLLHPLLVQLAHGVIGVDGRHAVPELLALLQKYGAQAITQLKPEQLGAFATELRGLGAKL